MTIKVYHLVLILRMYLQNVYVQWRERLFRSCTTATPPFFHWQVKDLSLTGKILSSPRAAPSFLVSSKMAFSQNTVNFLHAEELFEGVSEGLFSRFFFVFFSWVTGGERYREWEREREKGRIARLREIWTETEGWWLSRTPRDVRN